MGCETLLIRITYVNVRCLPIYLVSHVQIGKLGEKRGVAGFVLIECSDLLYGNARVLKHSLNNTMNVSSCCGD